MKPVADAVRTAALMGAALALACGHEPTVPDIDSWVVATAKAVSSAVPAVPSNVLVTLGAGQKVTVTWQDNSTNETGFEVRRNSSGSPTTLLAAANAALLVDSGVAYATWYCYDVRAVRKVGQKANYSAYSNTSCVTTPPPPPPPPTSVTGVTTKAVRGMIEVIWSWYVQPYATAYRIERSIDGAASWSPVYTMPASNPRAYYDTPIIAERSHCYRVTSINEGGEAPPSNSSCAAAPNAPQLTATAVGEQTLLLNWTDNSSIEDGYEVWLYGFRPTSGCYPPNNDGYDSGTAEVEYMVVRLPANTTSWQVPTMVETECFPPMEFWYYVFATSNGGTSNSSTVSASGSGASMRIRK